MLAHRVGEAGDADQSRVGRDQEDHRGQDADVVAEDFGRAAGEAEVLDDAEDRVVGVLRAERGVVAAADRVVDDRHRREGDDRDQQVEAEHRDDDAADAAGDRPRRVLGLLGHVRDRLDPGVGDHPDRDAEREVAPGRGDAEVDVVDQDLRAEHEDDPDADQDHLGAEVGDRQDQVEFRGLLGAADVERGEADDERGAADDVPRAVAEPGPEDGQVVGHEEGRDRDRDRVVQHLAPGGDEADELVEGVAGEARGAARLGEHHGRLGVGGGGGGEDQPGDDEGDRGQPEGECGGDAEGVVDRGADVAVGGGEQSPDAVDTAQRFVSWDSPGHLSGGRHAGIRHFFIRIYARRQRARQVSAFRHRREASRSAGSVTTGLSLRADRVRRSRRCGRRRRGCRGSLPGAYRAAAPGPSFRGRPTSGSGSACPPSPGCRPWCPRSP